jgi:predicted nucleic acid-binding protein
MGWLDSLHDSVVGFDTMPLIYYIEENPNYSNVVDPFFEAIERSEFKVVTSIVTLLEVLVHPIRNANAILAQKYRDLLFDTEGLSTMELHQEIAEEAARLRAVHNIRTPDSIQMATAIFGGASFFLTNDTRLPSLPNLKTLVLEDLKKGSEG